MRKFTAVQPANMMFWLTLTTLTELFSAAADRCFQGKRSKNTLYTTYAAPNSMQTISDYLVNIVEHLAANESDITLRNWQGP